MQDLARAVRFAGIAVGVLLLISMVWVVLLGPALLVLVSPRS